MAPVTRDSGEGEPAMADGENARLTFRAVRAPQGDIALLTPARRAIFFAGMLAGLALVLLAEYFYLR